MKFEEDLTLKEGGDGVSESLRASNMRKLSLIWKPRVISHDGAFDFMYSYDW